MSIAPVSLRDDARDPDGFARALGASFARFGFAVIEDHGASPALIEAVRRDARDLFALPEADKLAYRPPGAQGRRGYTPFGVETAKGAHHHDLKEFWHVGRGDAPIRPAAQPLPAPELLPTNVWPWQVPSLEPDVGALYDRLEAIGGVILAAVARHLGLDAGFFEAPVRGGDSILRLLHYPPTEGDGPHLRAAAHEDINVITLLLGAEEAGLEILDRNGRWLPVSPPPGALVVNVGDMLARLTRGALPSTTHRVVNPTPDRRSAARYSTPFFLHFASDYLIDGLPGSAPSAATPPITAGDFLLERLREIRLA